MSLIKPGTLAIATKNTLVAKLMKKLLKAEFPELKSLTPEVFFRTKPKVFTWWGQIQIAPEAQWLLAPVDYVITLNQKLWDECRDDAIREGILAHLLSRIHVVKKRNVVVHQETSKGERVMLANSKSDTSMPVHPEVIARHPALLKLDEIDRFLQAAEDGDQYLLNLANEKEADQEAATG